MNGELLVHALGGSIKIRQMPEEPGIHYADVETAGMRDHLQCTIDRIKMKCGIDPDQKGRRLVEDQLLDFRTKLKQDRIYRKILSEILSWSMFGDTPRKKQLVVTEEMIAQLPLPEWDELILAWCPSLLQYVDEQLAFCDMFPCRSAKESGLIKIIPTSWSTVHSFAVQLQRQSNLQYNFCGGVMPIAQLGFTVTKDRCVVLGIRAGSYEQNKIALVPAGSASWPSLSNSFYDELQEELAVLPGDLTRQPQLAAIYCSGGRLFCVHMLETSLTSIELYERWKESSDKHEHQEVFCYPVELLNPADIRTHLKSAFGINADWSRVALPALRVGEAYYFRDAERLRGVFTNEQQIFSSL